MQRLARILNHLFDLRFLKPRPSFMHLYVFKVFQFVLISLFNFKQKFEECELLVRTIHTHGIYNKKLIIYKFN